MGWLGRYLESVPFDPLVGWSATRELPRALMSREVSVPAIPDARTYAFNSPNAGAEAMYERTAATRIASHVPLNRPQVAFVNGTAVGALATLDRVASVSAYTGTVAYPGGNNALAAALRTVAGSIAQGTGTRVYWVQTGGYDTHANQNAANSYPNLMATLGDAVRAFYIDLRNQGLLGDTLMLVFSEFGRRVSENGGGASAGTDHGAGGVMMAMGGAVRGGIYGTAPSLDPNPANPTLENNGGDVRYETDFRSVYARVLDNWLGASSTSILGGDFRTGAPQIV
jgi:uncharacterized protein (DUF1501 family)